MYDTEDDNYGPRIGLNLDERAVRSLHSAVKFTLDKWAGQEPLDQEQLIGLKHSLQAAVLEFHLLK